MKKITKALSLVMIMTLCIFTLTACGGSDDANAGADTEKEAMTTLVFGTSADYAPFEFMYPDENGDMVYGGIDVEVAQYIADYMGVKLQTENMSFNNLLTALNKGQFGRERYRIPRPLRWPCSHLNRTCTSTLCRDGE